MSGALATLDAPAIFGDLRAVDLAAALVAVALALGDGFAPVFFAVAFVGVTCFLAAIEILYVQASLNLS